MNLVRQALAVFLSIFLASPVLATENKADSKKDGDKYNFFTLGVQPIDLSGRVDWDKECVVVLQDVSPRIRIQYKRKDSDLVRVTNWGNLRSGVEVVVDAYTGHALRVRVCGNGIVEPKDWVPTGAEECREEESPTMKPGDVVPVVAPSSPSSVSEAPKFGLGLDPGDIGAKNLRFEKAKMIPASQSQSKKTEVGVGVADKGDKKSKAWIYVLGGVLLGVVAVGLASGGGSKKSSGGGPASDPKN